MSVNIFFNSSKLSFIVRSNTNRTAWAAENHSTENLSMGVYNPMDTFCSSCAVYKGNELSVKEKKQRKRKEREGKRKERKEEKGGKKKK